MEKEYVCVESANKDMVGLVFKLNERIMQEIQTKWCGVRIYRQVPYTSIYVERKDVSYMVFNGEEYVIVDSMGRIYYEGQFQHRWSLKWFKDKDYRICTEYNQDFEIGDIVKLRTKEETRLEVVEKVYCRTTKNASFINNYKNHYLYKLKGKSGLYTINDIQLAFKKDEFTFKKCIKSPSGGLVLNRIYRCHDYNPTYLYNYRSVYYESGFRKTLHKQQLEYDYKFVDATLEEYLEQYNDQFEPKQKRIRTYSYSKRKEDGKAYRDNFADFINGKACVHINSESDMNWFRLALQQYGLEHKLSFKYDELILKVNYLCYEDDIVKFSPKLINNMKVLEVTDLL